MIRLPAWGLLSKYGFGDGDVPDAYLDWLDERELPYPKNWHALLRVLVRERLMPLLAGHAIELVEITTIHNPIRAARVDGRPVDDLSAAPWDDGLLPDVDAAISFEDVYELQVAP